MSEGRHTRGAETRRRRNVIIVAAIVVGLLVFVVGYVLGSDGGEIAASSSPSTTTPPSSAADSPSRSPEPSSSPEPSGDELPDGKYFVRLTDLQGGQGGPHLIRYDLAYYYTGDEANRIAASRGDETPVPNDVYVVNDNPKLRVVPLADRFTVQYLPEGSGLTDTVPASQDQFLVWLGETQQTDFPPKDSTYWWITINGGEVTTIDQQYQP